MVGWYASVGKGRVCVGPFPGIEGETYTWEDACDAAALAGCRLVVSVDAGLPGGVGTDPKTGLPVFAAACLARKMDWGHCPMPDGVVTDMAVDLVQSWTLSLSLGAKIWIQSCDPWAAWPLTSVALRCAGITPDSLGGVVVGGPDDTDRLVRVWHQAVAGVQRS